MARCTTCSSSVISFGCAASSRRSGMGSDSTHWRTGTCGMTWSTRCAARGTKPSALAAECHPLVVAAVAAAQTQEAVRQDAALEECIEPVFDEGRQAPTCGGLRFDAHPGIDRKAAAVRIVGHVVGTSHASRWPRVTNARRTRRRRSSCTWVTAASSRPVAG